MGGDGGDAGGLNVVPNLYLAKPLGAGWSVGLGVNAPWGLVTEYDNGWVGRFQAIKSSIKTIDVNPGVSWKVGSNMALGLGLNAQRMDAEFTNQVNYSGALLSAAAANGIAPGSAVFNAIAAATAGLESSARIKGLDTSYGWNAGVLWDMDGATRVGAHYRSSLKYQLEGSASFANPVPVVSAPLAATVGALSAGVNRALAGTTIQSLVKLPAVTNLSFFTKLDDRWDLMADAQWTGWSSIRSLTFTRGNGTVLQSTPENFRNTWKLAVGANYRLSDDLLLRGGLAIDQSPVRAAFRTPRLPDADRTWLSAGVQYTVNPRWKVDVSGAYLFVRNSVINANAGSAASFALVNGDYRSGTAIVSAQMTYAF